VGVVLGYSYLEAEIADATVAWGLDNPCRSSMARMRQSRPDSGPGSQVKILKPFYVVASSLGSGFHQFTRRVMDVTERVALPHALLNLAGSSLVMNEGMDLGRIEIAGGRETR